MSKIKVVLIYSLAYSGTSWFTTVLGSAKGMVNLGAGDRLFVEGPEKPEAMCLIHPGQCEYWPSFFRRYKPRENFFVQLADHTGNDAFVLNNPSLKLFDREFTDDRLDVRVIKQVRDGRASLASAMRHHPHRVRNVYQSALAWLYRGTKNLERRVDHTRKESIFIRYEDAVRNPNGMLEAVAAHTGVPYTADSLRYWEYEHHLSGSNQGALSILMRLQGHSGLQHERRDYYDELLEHIKKTQGRPKLDESWKKAYDEVDMAAYDFVAGELYEEYGYERPHVEDWAREEFKRVYNPPTTPAEAVKDVPQWRLPEELKQMAQKKKLPNRLVDRFKAWVRRLGKG